MAVRHGYGKIAGTDALVFAYDTGDTRNSYKGEPTTNMWGIETGGNVNGRSGWDMPYAYNGAITNTVYSSGTWNGNRIWEVLHTLGTSGYAGYESWRLCVNQPAAGTGTYSTTRRVAIKICVLEGSITDMALHSGGGNGSYNGANWTPIPESQVPRDCPIKTGWYQFLADGSWNSDSVGHCVGLGFISYNRVRILTTEPMYYPSSKLLPFTGYQRSNTQGLLDLTGNKTIDLSNVSFDSNAQMFFDGTDDYIDIPNSTTLFSGTQDFTVEAAYNMEGQGGGAILGNYGPGYTTNHLWFSGQYGIWLDGGVYAPGYPLSNGRYHMVGTRESGVMKLYLNGVLVNSGTRSNSIATDIDYRIGADVSSPNEEFTGDIYVVKAYNRALTADEIRNNYNQYRTRFNI